jgi:hypothetical protein
MAYHKESGYSPIFIGGRGRSGTSILGHLFMAHPDVCYFAEPRFLIDRGGLNDLLPGWIDTDTAPSKIRSQ